MSKSKVCLGGEGGLGCSKQPAFGFSGKKAEFCSRHKMEGMINLRNRRCEHIGCTKEPYFGHEGQKARFCSCHKAESMVDVRHRRCEHHTCSKQPNYARSGERARFCAVHRLPGMIDVKHRRCHVSPCGKYPYYCLRGYKLRACELHRTAGMERVSPRSAQVSSSGSAEQNNVGYCVPTMTDEYLLSTLSSGSSSEIGSRASSPLHRPSLKTESCLDSSRNGQMLAFDSHSASYLGSVTTYVNPIVPPSILPLYQSTLFCNPYFSGQSSEDEKVSASYVFSCPAGNVAASVPEANHFAIPSMSTWSSFGSNAFGLSIPTEFGSLTQCTDKKLKRKEQPIVPNSDRTSSIIYTYKKRRVECDGQTMQVLEMLV